MEGALRSGQRVAQKVLASLVEARADGSNTGEQSGTSPDATRENTASPTPFSTAIIYEEYESMVRAVACVFLHCFYTVVTLLVHTSTHAYITDFFSLIHVFQRKY
jgi:hypothetical protein